MGERTPVEPGALIASWVFAGSVALLALNDHVLKAAWPGVVTGKSSDVAGVAMVAIGVTALLRHRAAAFALTAVAFGLLKTVPVAALALAPVLGGVTRTDPTDVAALLVLVPLWSWVARRSTTRQTRVGASWRGWRTVPVQAVLVGCAVMATTATSYDCTAHGVAAVEMSGDTVAAVTSEGRYLSDDGGVGWRPDEPSPGAMTASRIEHPDDPAASQEEEVVTPCVGARRCVRTRLQPIGRPEEGSIIIIEEIDRRVGGVEGVTDDDLASPILAIEPSDVVALRRIADEPPGSCSWLGGRSAVAVELPDGDHTVVAMGTVGVLHQVPAGGWEWVAVGDFGLRPRQVDDEPFDISVRSTLPNDTMSRLLAPLGPVLLILAPIALAVWVPILRRIAGGRGSPTVATAMSIALAIVLAVIGIGFGLIVLALYGSVPLGMGVTWAVIAATTIVSTWLYHRRPAAPAVKEPALPPPPTVVRSEAAEYADRDDHHADDDQRSAQRLHDEPR